jgi:hypothetical protein
MNQWIHALRLRNVNGLIQDAVAVENAVAF